MRHAPFIFGFLVTGCSNAISVLDDASVDVAEGEPLAEAKVLIEHNAADADSGFQLFVDGEPWDRLTVEGPDGRVLEVRADGELNGFGLTEAFFETNEPHEDDLAFEDVLALFPEGDYEFEAISSEEGTAMRRVARLTHAVPAPALILAPAEEAVVGLRDVVVEWVPVVRSVTDEEIDIVGYQVIVGDAEEHPPSQSFFKREMSVFLPPSKTRVGIPQEFLESGGSYEIEVLAIERSGNQTISIRTFSVREAGRLSGKLHP